MPCRGRLRSRGTFQAEGRALHGEPGSSDSSQHHTSMKKHEETLQILWLGVLQPLNLLGCQKNQARTCMAIAWASPRLRHVAPRMSGSFSLFDLNCSKLFKIVQNCSKLFKIVQTLVFQVLMAVWLMSLSSLFSLVAPGMRRFPWLCLCHENEAEFKARKG